MPGPNLDGYERATFTHGGRTHDVYRAGSGPAVVVVHEIPGIHPGVLDLAARLRTRGYTTYLPSLFGTPGSPDSRGAIAGSIAHVCISREFSVLADRTSPVASWLQALAADAFRACGGSGVGAIGMCFTGGFALAMALEPAVLAAVLSQPALPAPIGRRKAALGLDAADREQIATRTERGDLGVLALRFTEDRGCPRERFATLRRELGDGVETIEIDSSPGNPAGIRRRAHAVLTIDLVDEPGHPTRLALDRVLAFLDERLHA
jgi:dienelactone hydrolase